MLRQIATINQLKEAISRVVAYDWEAEQDDFERNPNESHIFHTLKALDAWIGGESDA